MPDVAVKQPNKHKNTPVFDLSGPPWTMLEFFAGSGLVAYGLQGMFKPVWSNDISTQKKAVYAANFGSEHFYLGDISNVDGRSLPSANMSWASFPCQDLSLAGSYKGIDQSRSGLVWEWARVIREMEIKPKVLVLENVIGLLTSKDGKDYCALHDVITGLGYVSGAIVLNASCFVPQSRPRVFIICVRKNLSIPQELIGDGPCWLHNSSLEKLGNKLPGWIWWKTDKPPSRTATLKDIVDHNVVFDKDDVLKLLPEHHRAKLFADEEVYATGYRRIRNKHQVLELRFDGIAGCLRTPTGGSSKQYLVVQKDGIAHARLLTVRETARLMGAPECFELPGSYNDGYMAMGDAVVAPVARFIGEKFLLRLVEAVYDNESYCKARRIRKRERNCHSGTAIGCNTDYPHGQRKGIPGKTRRL